MNANQALEFKTVEVSHDEFRRGLPHGRFRVIVNPDLAPKYVQHRLAIKFLMLPVLGVGIALGLSGYIWAGLVLVSIGSLTPRLIRKSAPALLLHLASHNEDVYREAIEYEILEVRGQSIRPASTQTS